MSALAGFTHVFAPGSPSSSRVLLALHGTGGDENDLVPFARSIDPAAHVLSPRGKVMEHGMPRFFRRLAEGVFDEEDLKRRTHELADFIEEARKTYNLGAKRIVACGYSNGANIAASLLLTRPDSLDGAMLARAMVPFEPATVPPLTGKRVLLLAGERDAYSRRPVTERLAEIFRSGGARVDVSYTPAGHELTQQDAAVAKKFLASA